MHLNFYQLVAQKAKYKKNSTFSMYLYVEDVEFFFIFDLLSDWLLNKNSGTCGYIMINIELKANIETKDSIFFKKSNLQI